ncbi:MAG: hypothetical protein NWF05_07940 [Candidatus Bathyarchaeota archaeon]|nr:hypothetical protein [Candidatus Bathyarchaeota archaeon]
MDLERQFVDFLNYVPYLDGNESVYSFRLANLILAIGAHVDSAFKEMFRCPNFLDKFPETFKKVQDGKAAMQDYRELENEYDLSKRIVIFKRLPNHEYICPFQQFEKSTSPDWWKSYNGIKHEFSLNFKKANLRHVKEALAGAFLLNVVHKPAILRLYKYGVAKNPYREVVPKLDDGEYDVADIDDILKGTIYPPLYVETNLFYFNCEAPTGSR